MTPSKSVMDRRLVCPACEESPVEESFEQIDAFCNACGFVIHQGRLDETLREHRNVGVNVAEVPEEKPRWSEFHKARNSTEHRVATTLEYLEFIGERVHLSSDVRLQAAEIYAEAVQQGLIEGRRTEDVINAIVCLATRQVGEPIPINRIASRTGENPQSIGKLTKQLQRELEIQDTECLPEAYVEGICGALGCEEATVTSAITLAQASQKAGLSIGRNPAGVAAAVIYLVECEERTQKEVAAAAGVSRETVRVRVKEFGQRGLVDA